MSYCQDLRDRVFSFLDAGGTQVEAARRFQIHPDTVRVWLKQPRELQPQKTGPKGNRKFDRRELAYAVHLRPDLLLKELAEYFGVSVATVSETLTQMGIKRTKRSTVQGYAVLSPMVVVERKVARC